MTLQSDLVYLRTLTRTFADTTLETRNDLIFSIANHIDTHTRELIEANMLDLAKMDPSDPLYDRVILTEARIQSMIESCHDLIAIDDPLDHQTTITTESPIHLVSKTVPLGVVACIYEARPNVTLDLSILCIKSGNICVLKGGSQASMTNAYLRNLIQEVFMQHGLDRNCLYGFSEKREDLNILLEAEGYIDVIIPRGGKGLIDFVRKNALVSTIETGAGVVHIYLDKDIKPENYTKICDVILNAKISRPSVCNALDTLIIHRDAPPELIHLILTSLQEKGVTLGMLADEKTFFANGENIATLTREYFHTEYLSLRCGIKIVANMEEAIRHIDAYSSHHSECILTDSQEVADIFQKQVDSAVVYHNTSTRFSDGSCFGFGAEVDISTQKIHARGPMGCKALTTYKYFVRSPYSTR